MTTSLSAEPSAERETEPRSRTWGDIVHRFAGSVAAMPDYDRGGLAGLRRMNPNEPDTAAFWRLMAAEDLLGNPEIERRWGLILHGIALMTRNAGGGEVTIRSAHDGRVPVGQTLYLGGESQRSKAFYSETRLTRLLTARGDMFRVLLARMFRMLSSANVSFNWREMARLILTDEFDEEQAEQGRRRIARDYYRSERRSSQQSEG